MRRYLETAEDWWAEVIECWTTRMARTGVPQLQELIFGDIGAPEDFPVKTILKSEELYGRGSKMAKMGFKGREELGIKAALQDLIDKKEPQLWYVFQSLWQDAPDKPHIHQWTMWGDFCDLCSEGPHCLWPEGGPPDE